MSLGVKSFATEGVHDKIHDKLHDKVHDKVRDKVHDKVHEKVHDKVHDKVRDKARDKVHDIRFTIGTKILVPRSLGEAVLNDGGTTLSTGTNRYPF